MVFELASICEVTWKSSREFHIEQSSVVLKVALGGEPWHMGIAIHMADRHQDHQSWPSSVIGTMARSVSARCCRPRGRIDGWSVLGRSRRPTGD